MRFQDLLRRIPVFLAVFAVISLLSPGDPFYLHAGVLQPHFWAAVVLAVWLGLWATVLSTAALAAAMLVAHASTVDPQEAEVVFAFQDLVQPLALVLVSAVVAYLADRLREGVQVQKLRVARAEASLAELGRLNEAADVARQELEREMQAFTQTPAQVAGIAERFEVGTRAELLHNLLRVSAEHVRSRAVAIYRYDTFSRWELVEAIGGRDGLGLAPTEQDFPAALDESQLTDPERAALQRALRHPGTSLAADGSFIHPDDLVLGLGGAAADSPFIGILLHRGVRFGETSPSARALLEAIARWASLVLRRQQEGNRP